MDFIFYFFFLIRKKNVFELEDVIEVIRYIYYMDINKICFLGY